METINFTRGVPANESFPTGDLIEAATAVFKSHGTTMLQYGPSRGFEPLRLWLAEWQGVSVDRIITSNGSLQLIEFLCLQMLKPGDLVFTESPSYDRTLGLLRRHGARVVGIPLETDGPKIEALERRSRRPCRVILMFRTSESGRRDMLGCQAAPDRRAGGAIRVPSRRDAPYRLLPLSSQGSRRSTRWLRSAPFI